LKKIKEKKKKKIEIALSFLCNLFLFGSDPEAQPNGFDKLHTHGGRC